MILSSAQTLGSKDFETIGVVSSEIVQGANVFKDMLANLADITGGRTRTYEKAIAKAKEEALIQLQKKASSVNADAIIGIELQVEFIGNKGSILMISAIGTAVKLISEN